MKNYPDLQSERQIGRQKGREESYRDRQAQRGVDKQKPLDRTIARHKIDRNRSTPTKDHVVHD